MKITIIMLPLQLFENQSRIKPLSIFKNIGDDNQGAGFKSNFIAQTTNRKSVDKFVDDANNQSDEQEKKQ
ncbi:unnamed protein product [Paramecium octaurelia]|uniref:Uncharacterized protein n=1 Tax=Paramecium octaurelia TaxID=43137 RepID=A0A8S1WCX0_PAROT|nr:unnamed protein product [Paramecium octaurelia]